MGGTSTDVCLIQGNLPFTRDYQFDGFPISIPVINIHTVRAGGGSLAWMDEGGLLKVGPRSEGANPGPACYGKGLSPTVTDANLLLRRIIPQYFAGGAFTLYPERSAEALRGIAQKVGLSLMECALGVIKIVNANMVRAIRKVSSERGLDPKDFWLLAYGGASGLHACQLVKMLNLKGVIAPRLASSFSALGLLTSTPIFDSSKTLLIPAHHTSEIKREIQTLREKSQREVARYGLTWEDFQEEFYVDLRYQGQGYDLTLPLSLQLIEAFHEAHQKEFGYHLPERPVELVNLRLRLRGPETTLNLTFFGKELKFSPFETKIFTEEGWVTFKFIPWGTLKVGEKVWGASLVG